LHRRKQVQETQRRLNLTAFVVTLNVGDVAGAERFGVEVIEPAEFLRRIGVIV
jgi:hypothetical protein